MDYLILLLTILGLDYNQKDNKLIDLAKKSNAYQAVLERTVSYNDGDAKFIRFQENIDKIHYHGERISLVFNNEKLLGFARFSQTDLVAQKELPTKKESEAIALQFLQMAAPDLLDNMKILWIKPHSEPLKNNNKIMEILGMKVKSRDLNTGLYFWVIIGSDKRVMTFERNIKWITFPGKRGTEKWLDDGWLEKNALLKHE